MSVLLVDDHRVFAEVLAMRLSSEESVGDVQMAFSLGAAKAMVNKHRPDIVLLDYDLAGECGLDLLPELEHMVPRPHVVVVSATYDPALLVDAFQCGAEAWVTKDGDFTILLAAINEVVHGHLYMQPEHLRSVISTLVDASRAPAAREHSFVDDLSVREMEVLRCLVAGMTRSEVAARLFISTNTVRTHVQNLLKRANLHSTLALVAAARALGITEIGAAEGRQVPIQRPRPGKADPV